jgi:hypothetical protein
MAEQGEKPKKTRAALVTERPVDSLPSTSVDQWVVTLNPTDGRVVKLERLDPTSGRRQELPRSENEALFSYLDLCVAYWRGAADFTAALAAGHLASLSAYPQYTTESSKMKKGSGS